MRKERRKSMFKRDYIKKLHELGVRYCEKQGYGNVKLEHLKNYQVVNLYAQTLASRAK